MSKLVCSFTIDIDVQELFKKVFIEDYQKRDDISDRDFLVESIYGVIKDMYINLIKDKMNRKLENPIFYEQTKQFLEVDIEIVRQMKQNLSIE